MSKIVITLERLESGVYLVEAAGVHVYARASANVLRVAASVLAERVHTVEVAQWGCDYDKARDDCRSFLEELDARR